MDFVWRLFIFEYSRYFYVYSLISHISITCDAQIIQNLKQFHYIYHSGFLFPPVDHSIEADAKKLRSIAETKQPKKVTFGDCTDEVAYIETLKGDVLNMEKNLALMFTDVCGTVEKRLGFVTMEELLMKCKALHKVNKGMITSLESHLTKFGYKGDSNKSNNMKNRYSGIFFFIF